MKKILFVTTVDTTVRAFLIPHIQYFLERGFEVEIATGIVNQEWARHNIPGVKVHPIPFHRSLKSPGNLRAFFSVLKLLRIKNYDLIHVHTPIASFVTRLASMFTKSKVLYTAHGFHFSENGSRLGNFLFKWAEKLAGLRTDKLIVINTDDQVAAAKIVPQRKIAYIKGVGVDTDLYSPLNDNLVKENFKNQLNIEVGQVVFTHIAEMNANKRQMDVIHAVEILKQSGIDKFIVLFVGNGINFEVIKQVVREKNLEDRIRCLGYRSDISEILSITDVGLLVSLREGLPRSVMEMMSMGIPVIATAIRGNRDLVVHGETGYLVPVKNPEILAQKMTALLFNGEHRRLFGSNARQRVQKEFALPEIISNMEVVYKELGI
ncbi:glycosyltransferase family 4 protein [Paenibacillus sp. 1P03SA]|uniref:glycosyltransferase family 4 protein n=1 Tax=Paenibacillus sp. 1P03SA TaxID=3132294 RepID=UPI00399FD023